MAEPAANARPDGETETTADAVTREGRQALQPRTLIGVIAAALLVLGAALMDAATGLDLLLALGLLLTLILAYLVGANSIAESIATLVGGGLADYRGALLWGAVWRLFGSIAAAFIARALVQTFTAGFFSSGTHLGEAVVVAISLGLLVWTLIATRIGLPVSASHALTGGLIIVGLAVVGAAGIRWSTLIEKVALPLALSPFLAAILALVLVLVVCRTAANLADSTLNKAHWFSSAALSFAHGLNEAPKLVVLPAMLLFVTHHAGTQAPFWLFPAIGVTMGVGSYWAGRRVTRTLAERVTDMDESDSFTANAVTAALVAASSVLGLPVSTAEVGAGSITGVGMRTGIRTVNWGIVRDMALAWVVTFPAAGLLSLGAYALLSLPARV